MLLFASSISSFCRQVLQAFVVVVHRHRQDALGRSGRSRTGRGCHRFPAASAGPTWPLAPPCSAPRLVADDVVAQLDAFVADEHRRPGDQLLHLMLALAAEGAIQQLFAVVGRFVFRSINASPLRGGRRLLAAITCPTKAVFLRFVGGHEIVAVGVARDFLHALAGVLRRACGSTARANTGFRAPGSRCPMAWPGRRPAAGGSSRASSAARNACPWRRPRSRNAPMLAAMAHAQRAKRRA